MRFPRQPLIALLAFGCGASTQPPGDVQTPAAANQAPVFLSSPSTTADHVRDWVYNVRVADPDSDDVQILVTAARWMSWDPAIRALSGVAGWDNLGPAGVRLLATDGVDTTEQLFSVDVRVGEIDCQTTFPGQATSEYVLPWPVGRTYELWIGHCPTRFSNHQSWFAWDFRIGMRDTITAVRAGTVTAVRDTFPDGTRVSGEENFIYVRHADGSMGFYVHLTQNGSLVTVGQTVAQGEPLALSGDSGGSAGPHLHFVVFRAGGFTRQYSTAISFRNHNGPLTSRGGLVEGASYTALP